MKGFFIFFLLLPVITIAQTKADYQKAMGKFVKFYNKKQGDSIVNLFDLKDRKSIEWMWTPKEINKLHEKYGLIKSFKYLMTAPDGNGGEAFEMMFSKIEKNVSNIILDKQKYIETLILITSEPKDKKPQKVK